MASMIVFDCFTVTSNYFELNARCYQSPPLAIAANADANCVGENSEAEPPSTSDGPISPSVV